MRKTVSLALGSGGARGYAHIGVIEVLLENDFQIKSIAGASMGAVIGGVYASGKLEKYKDWVTSLEKFDVWKMFDLSFNKKGIFKGDRIINYLEKNIIGEVNIEDFDTKFTAVAVDIVSHKEIWFSKGPLFDAIRASIAIPGIFTPFAKDDMILVDGGVLNPLPIAPVLNDHADIIIAVDVNSSKKPEFSFYAGKMYEAEEEDYKNYNMFNIMLQSINIMQNKISKFKLASYSPDLIIDIPKDYCSIFDFHKAKEMIEIGRIITKKKLMEQIK